MTMLKPAQVKRLRTNISGEPKLRRRISTKVSLQKSEFVLLYRQDQPFDGPTYVPLARSCPPLTSKKAGSICRHAQSGQTPGDGCNKNEREREIEGEGCTKEFKSCKK